eukprot:5701903-Amphidinium_carterae.1
MSLGCGRRAQPLPLSYDAAVSRTLVGLGRVSFKRWAFGNRVESVAFFFPPSPAGPLLALAQPLEK